jgi:hypothetical protein
LSVRAAARGAVAAAFALTLRAPVTRAQEPLVGPTVRLLRRGAGTGGRAPEASHQTRLGHGSPP